MEGMGRSMGGPSLTLVTAGTVAVVIASIALLLFLGGAEASANGGGGPHDLPDLVITEAYNLTPVYQGEDSFFNVTIGNQGTAAYLVRTSGDLELFAFRDTEDEVAGYTKVYCDIYKRSNVTVNIKVRFQTMGDHSVRFVLDRAERVDELEDDNNEAKVQVLVVSSTENRPPEADGGNDRFGYVGEPLLFSAKYSDDVDGDPLSYLWVFGDGAEGTGMYINHTYLVQGEYGVSLIVSDGDKIDIDTFTVRVMERPVNHVPRAVITVDKLAAKTDETVIFDGTSSWDQDGDDLRYDWDFDESDGVDDWLRGAIVSNSWDSVGQYMVTLRVSDGQDTATANITISVVSPPPPNERPRASAGPDRYAIVKKEFQLTGEGSDPDGRIVSWEWDLDGDGTFDTYSSDNGTVRYTFGKVGVYTLWLRVTDNRGSTSKDSVIITVEKAQGEDNETPGPTALVAVLALCIASMALTRGLYRERWRRYYR